MSLDIALSFLGIRYLLLPRSCDLPPPPPFPKNMEMMLLVIVAALVVPMLALRVILTHHPHRPRRSRLTILPATTTSQFSVTFKPSDPYKPSQPGQISDRERDFILLATSESMAILAIRFLVSELGELIWECFFMAVLWLLPVLAPLRFRSLSVRGIRVVDAIIPMQALYVSVGLVLLGRSYLGRPMG